MKNRATLRPRQILLALALLVLALPAAAMDCRHAAERRASIATAGATSVIVNARAGDLSLRPAADATLSAHGRACASSERWLGETNLAVRREGNVLRIDVLVPDDIVGIGLSYATLDLTVEVPAGLPIVVTDSSGDIEASDVRVARVTDSSGDIVLRHLRGDVEIQDSSGDVTVADAAGRVQVRDSSGDIVVVGAAEVLIPNDSSGDIRIERVAGSVRIEQDSSGDIVVADVGRDFTLASDSSGEVRHSRVRGRVQLPD